MSLNDINIMSRACLCFRYRNNTFFNTDFIVLFGYGKNMYSHNNHFFL